MSAFPERGDTDFVPEYSMVTRLARVLLAHSFHVLRLCTKRMWPSAKPSAIMVTVDLRLTPDFEIGGYTLKKGATDLDTFTPGQYDFHCVNLVCS